MKTKCDGCGVAIQTTDKESLGYIRPDIYERDPDNFLCERCFRLKHYNENKTGKVLIQNNEEYIKKVKETIAPEDLIVNIIDCFDLEGSVFLNISSLFPDNPLIIIANKYDLFLRSNRPTKFRDYLSSYLNERNICPSKVLITSAIDPKTPERIYNLLALASESKKVFLMGMTNVGKSTLLNSLINMYSDEKDVLTTSNTIGTTIDLNEIKLKSLTFYDTPGFINDKQFTYYLLKKSLNYCIPKKYVKPRIYQLNPNQTVFVNGIFSLSYLEGEKNSFIFYVSNSIMLYRTKLENRENYYLSHQNDLLNVPNAEEKVNLGSLVTLDFSISKDEEIAISGVGFVGFSGKGKIQIQTFEKIMVSKRRSII